MTDANQCPRCGKPNTDNWPLDIDGEIRDGGCQMCWERQCDDEWYERIRAITDAGYGVECEC